MSEVFRSSYIWQRCEKYRKTLFCALIQNPNYQVFITLQPSDDGTSHRGATLIPRRVKIDSSLCPSIPFSFFLDLPSINFYGCQSSQMGGRAIIGSK